MSCGLSDASNPALALSSLCGRPEGQGAVAMTTWFPLVAWDCFDIHTAERNPDLDILPPANKLEVAKFYEA